MLTKQKIQKLFTYIICILSILIIVIYNLPSKYLTNWLQKKANARVQFINPQGTIFDGNSYIGLSYGIKDKQPKILANPIKWKFNIFKARIEVTSEDINSNDENKFYYNLISTKSNTAKINLPIDWFNGLAGPLNNLSLQGQLIVELPAIEWKNQQDLQSKQINLYLNNIYSEHFPEQILGSYLVQFNFINNPIFSVQTQSGLLNIKGNGTTNPLKFSGQAEIINEYQRQQLQPLLRLLGSSNTISSLNSNIINIEF